MQSENSTRHGKLEPETDLEKLLLECLMDDPEDSESSSSGSDIHETPSAGDSVVAPAPSGDSKKTPAVAPNRPIEVKTPQSAASPKVEAKTPQSAATPKAVAATGSKFDAPHRRRTGFGRRHRPGHDIFGARASRSRRPAGQRAQLLRRYSDPQRRLVRRRRHRRRQGGGRGLGDRT